MAQKVTVVREYEDQYTDGPNTIQNYGGRPQVIREFDVKEHEVTNQPGSKDSWNNDMDNPLGPA